LPSFLFIILFPLIAAAVYLYWRYRYGLPPEGFPGVLAYHKIGGFELSGTWITPRRFERHIDYLLESGFSFIDEDAFIETVTGLRKVSGMELLLTFDDGYSDLLWEALPVLESRSIPALAFIVTSYVGQENRWELNLPRRRSLHLDWAGLEKLLASGFSLGSHTATHRDLTRLSPERAREELVLSRETLREKLAVEVKSLSYPFGRFSPAVREEAEKAGYSAAFSMYPPFSNRRIDRYALRREGVYVIDSAFSVRNKLPGGNLYWLEDIKGRMINGVSVLTPLIKEAGRERVK
jgi:peptidoglycan/xylan/chitin deacetylase (PgdA/CDA1 family)